MFFEGQRYLVFSGFKEIEHADSGKKTGGDRQIFDVTIRE
jgi:hypothetical protein